MFHFEDFNKVENQEFTLRIDGNEDIKFNGVFVSSASSEYYYADRTGRWLELYLYRTKAGKFVCHKLECSNRENEETKYRGKVCESIDDIKKFFGQNQTAKQLYKEACINNLNEIE